MEHQHLHYFRALTTQLVTSNKSTSFMRSRGPNFTPPRQNIPGVSSSLPVFPAGNTQPQDTPLEGAQRFVTKSKPETFVVASSLYSSNKSTLGSPHFIREKLPSENQVSVDRSIHGASRPPPESERCPHQWFFCAFFCFPSSTAVKCSSCCSQPPEWCQRRHGGSNKNKNVSSA